MLPKDAPSPGMGFDTILRDGNTPYKLGSNVLITFRTMKPLIEKVYLLH